MTDQTTPGPLRVASPVDDADRRILAELGAGRLEALEALHDRYRAMAFAIALRITADATLAEDVAQDAFLGVWGHADRYVEGRGSVKTWLLSIVHHRAIDAVRRRRPAVELPDPKIPPPPQLIAADVWPEVAGRLDAVAVQAALATLSAVQREAIELAQAAARRRGVDRGAPGPCLRPGRRRRGRPGPCPSRSRARRRRR